MDAINAKDFYSMFPDEILYNKNINLDKLFDENPDYFYHLMKSCACYKNGPILKLNYVPGMKTSYEKNFY